MQWLIHISAFIFIVFWVVLQFIKLKTQKQKKYSREAFAFFSSLRRIILALLLFLILFPKFGYFDIVFSMVQSIPQEILKSRVGIKIILLCVTMFAYILNFAKSTKLHNRWNGARSERQILLDKKLNNNPNFFSRAKLYLKDVRIYFFKKRYSRQLKIHNIAHQTVQDSFEYERELPWYQEFAEMYSSYAKRIHLSPDLNWYPDGYCYVCEYDDSKYMAVLVCEDFPENDALKMFFKFIKRLGHEYSSIILAVKNNPDNHADYSMQSNGFDIDVRYKNNLLDKLVDFTPYFNYIKKKMTEQIDVDIALSLNDIYTPLDCKENATGNNFNVDEYVDNWIEENSHRQLALVGEYGQGKTATALYLTARLISNDSKRIPIYIPLRGKAPRNETPLDIFASFSSLFGIDPVALKILNANGRLLLIFDGFDEMDYVGDWSVRRLHFRSLWKLISPSAKMILTGRQNYFADIDEFSSALCSEIADHNIPYGSIITLCKFTSEQIDTVLEKAEPEIKNGIKSVLEKSTSKQFADLISRPSNLSLVIRIWKPRNLIDKSNNLTAASVIDEFLKNSYERQSEKNVHTMYSVLSPLEREYFMMGIALKMYSLQTMKLDNAVLEETIDILVDKFPDEISKKTPAIFDYRNGKNIRDYYDEKQENRVAIITDIRTCGILVNDSLLNFWEFAHTSFFDLLVAKCFWGNYTSNNDIYHYIANSVFEQSDVNVRSLRRNDLAQKKMLSELLITTFALSEEKQLKSPAYLFKKCYSKIVSFMSLRTSPSSVFKKYAALTDDTVLTHGGAAIQKGETFRLLAFPVIILSFCVFSFLTRSISLWSALSDNNYNFILNPELPANARNQYSDVGFMPLTQIWIMLISLIIIATIIVIFYYVRKKSNKEQIGKIEVAFFTWYYTARDAGISEASLIECIDRKDRKAFREFISRLELNFD